MRDLRRVSARIPPGLHQRVRVAAARRELTISQAVEEALAAWVEAEERR